MLILQVCDFGNDGDSVYRLRSPSQFLAKLPGVSVIDCHFFSQQLRELAEQADVVILQFVNDWDLVWLCSRRRAMGKVTVFEANDYFFDMQPWNMIAGQWQDPTIRELYLQLLEQADAVQTSTEELARRWREFGAREVAVFPNQLAEVPALPAMQERPLTVGWGGSPGHLGDWYAVAPVLQRWLEEHTDVHLAVMTGEPGRNFFRLAPERYHFQPFGSLSDYLAFLGRIDIGLAPLLATDYNRCRSDVKFLEYASRGVAGIYSDLEPYRGSVVANETGLLYRTDEGLISSLEALRNDLQLCQRLRENGYAYVAKQRMLESHIGERLTWYQSLVHGSAGSASRTEYFGTGESVRHANPAVAADAGRALSAIDAPYVAIPAQESERALLEAIAMPSAAEGARRIAPIVQGNPQYLQALQYYARFLNSRRDCRLALEHLDRARTLQPDNPHTLSEIGRSFFLLEDRIKAREILERAVEIEPRYLPAWQYLLHLLAWTRAPDGQTWAKRAETLFPACYSVALAGVRLFPQDEQPRIMLRILDRFAPLITHNERLTAIAAFRHTILTVARQTPGKDSLELLRRACQCFPESPQLAGEFGTALLQQGFASDAFTEQARALALRRQAAIDRQEYNPDVPVPHEWQFAQHILAADNERGKSSCD